MALREVATAAPALTDSEDAPGALRDLTHGPRYRGAIYSWRQGVLSGWAVDLLHPTSPVRVALEAAGRVILEAETGEARPDLFGPLPGNVAGFSLDLGAAAPDALGAMEATLAAAPPSALVEPGLLALRLAGQGPRIDLGRNGVSVRKALGECRAARAKLAPPAPREPEPTSPPPLAPASAPLPELAQTQPDIPPPPSPRREIGGGLRYVAGIEGLAESRLTGWAVDLLNPRAAVSLRLEVKGEVILALRTSEHRADIGAVLEGNVAGFALDLAALPPPAAQALAAALDGADPAALAPPRLVALRMEADNSLIDLGAFGVTLGDLGRALRGEPPAPFEPVAAPAPRTPVPRVDRQSRALRWLLGYLDGGADGRPARRFAERLLADLARAQAVSAEVKRHAAEIAPLFDPFHYLDRLADPGEALANPLLHYALAGWREGVSPSPLFSPQHYRRLRGEIAGDPLLDFMRAGAQEGVDPHPLFDVSFYRARHLNDPAVNPLVHYLEEGGKRGLDPSPLFDTPRFVAAYGESAEAPLEAYLANPERWDFALAPAFDARLYSYQIEIERGERLSEPPYVHYLTRGFRDETLLPNLLFDPAFYRERNKLDLAEPALAHYLREGEAAGLSCHEFFSPEFYNRERGGAEGSALVHALAHPGEIRSDPRMDAPIDQRLFAFVADLIAENGEETYRASVYREANPDLGQLDDKALEAHHRRNAAIQKRLFSLTQMMRLCELRVRDIPLGFVLADYTSIYKDLGPLKERFVSALFHWGRHGRHERRLIGRWKFRLFDLALNPPTSAAPLQIEHADERRDVCVLIHAFYPDLLPELVGFARNFRDVSFDVFINVVDEAWTPEVQAELRAICPGAYVMLSNDNGRDIGGFTRLIGQIDVSRYDLFAFMHSKKSPHIEAETGIYWRRALLGAIAGSPEIALENVEMFRSDPQIGMIGCKEWRSHDMGKNVEQYEALLDLFGVRGKNRDLDYLSGFMFLTRAEVVTRLYEVLRKLDFEYGGDKDLEFHIDGQIAHGVERALPALVRQMGYDIHYR
jgi:hypothetical protein